ncbi:10 TM acyl transferase domain found in Cas1p-domain-containing protein [Lipomyces arxii]|uniref:10 TM acyl transferase domain found in Cas1p-domain-containing protein n=1 Tax=Lipomyces arxii TaxID=56418 RepID=UPI0034CE6BEB
MAILLSQLMPGGDHVKRSFFIYGVFVFVVALWRYAASDVFDPYKCGALLAAGEWLDDFPESANGPSNWQPPGCKFRNYNTKDANQCLREQHVLFAGDSTVRQLFWQTVMTLDPSVSETTEKHSDIRFVKDELSVEFLWDPYLNSTALRRVSACGQDAELPNAYVVLGGGLWFARYLGDNGVNVWKEHTDRIVETVKACPQYYSLPFILPVTVPEYTKLNVERSGTILKSEIEYMNNYLKWISQQSGIIVPSAINDMMTKSMYASDESGIHSTQNVAKAKADLLLNMRCNQKLMDLNGYPYDKTCCYRYPGPTFIQWIVLIVVVLVMPALYINSSRLLSSPRMWSEGASGNALITAGFIFATTLSYCYFADRSSLFNKAAKQFLTSQFTVMTIMTIVIGALTLKRSDSEQGFMGRDQSNEWKGWMQIMVLIYHITGASKVLPIYKVIRVMVAAYLFMTGYGHTVFFYKKADFGIKRVASVLVRLNMLSCALAYIMNTDYLFYYFAPLSSFWFLVVYATMYVQSQRNKDIRFLVAKIAVSAVIVNLLVSVHGFLESIWFVLERVFFISWNLKEWRFRVQLDMYIVFIGMLGGLLSIKFAELKLVQHPNWPTARLAILGASVAALFVYWAMTETWSSKVEYNSWHPYISFLPILGFLFLRNATHGAQNIYSTAWAWVGTCSLETFTLQFHIWMAADTNGVLEVISSRHRVLNLLVTTPLFLFVSNVTADATGKLTAAIVNGIKKPAPKPKAPQPPKEVLPVVEPEKTEQTTVSESETASVPSPAAEQPSGFAPAEPTDESASTAAAGLAETQARPENAADIEKGDFGSNGNTTRTNDVLRNSFAGKLLEHPMVESIWNEMGDLRVRLFTILASMWAFNIISSFSR